MGMAQKALQLPELQNQTLRPHPQNGTRVVVARARTQLHLLQNPRCPPLARLLTPVGNAVLAASFLVADAITGRAVPFVTLTTKNVVTKRKTQAKPRKLRLR